MKKLLLFYSLALLLCAGTAHAFLGVDAGLYPWADACGPEIDEYCAETNNLGDCMLTNVSEFDSDCGDAVFYWAGDRYGWRDPHMRDRWHGLSPDERRAYRTDHARDFEEVRSGDRAGASGIMNRPPAVGMGMGFHGGGFHGGMGGGRR
ncbi:MAG: hypothetical protein FWF97_02265 [Alphaproteobacteria bacterium]|nr:hypothetical protein [Alphaproteobacteria bacterium]